MHVLGFVFLLSSPGCLFKGQESTMSMCVCGACAFGACVRGRETPSLSKLIRRGIRMEVKYWATCNERSRVGDILGSGPHQTVVLGQSGIDFHSFGDEGGRG